MAESTNQPSPVPLLMGTVALSEASWCIGDGLSHREYLLGMTKVAIENDHRQFVSFPSKNGGSFHGYVSLPEGTCLPASIHRMLKGAVKGASWSCIHISKKHLGASWSYE